MNLPIVFVQLGLPPTKLLLRNMEAIHADFPNIELHVVTDKAWDKKFPNWVSTFRIPSTGYASQIVRSPHSTQFRSGYWLYVSKRLGALADWHVSHASKGLLHLEGDMMIFPNFPFIRLERLNTLAWLRYVSDIDMPGLLFSPDPEETTWLAERVAFYANGNPSKTDMQALRLIAKESPERVRYLPGISSLLENGDPASVDSLKHIEEFGGIFDAAPVGQYLAGEDPRNTWGRRGLGPRSNSAIRNDNVEFFSKSGCLRVSTESNPGQTQIFNLHVHSKDLRLFAVRSRNRALSTLVRQASEARVLFSATGFFGAFRQLVEAGVHRISRALKK